MNRIRTTTQQKDKVFSMFFTAGHPNLNDTQTIIEQLEKNGVDMVEIGLPFSDPLADGPTIQESSTIALRNGMTTELFFEQLKYIRKSVSIPLIIMGYFNPVLQYGVEAFCKKCKLVGIDGLILPDLPLAEYNMHYRSFFEAHGLINIFLITPQTSEERIREIDASSNGFIYLVSSMSTTGKTAGFGSEQQAYFSRISNMNLNNPLIVGFGINDSNTFQMATKQNKGAIIGSAFVKMLQADGLEGIAPFVQSIRSH